MNTLPALIENNFHVIALPHAQLTITNVSPRIRKAIQQINRTPVSAVISSIRADAPNTPDVSFNLVINGIKLNGQNVVGTLIFYNYYQEPFPKDLVAPHNFPGVFTTA